MSVLRTPSVIQPQSKPSLSTYARLRHDATRDRWIILAPERVFEPDAVAVSVLRLCDGSRTVEDIAVDLGRSYDADHAQILADILPMLQDLVDKGVVWANARDA